MINFSCSPVLKTRLGNTRARPSSVSVAFPYSEIWLVLKHLGRQMSDSYAFDFRHQRVCWRSPSTEHLAASTLLRIAWWCRLYLEWAYLCTAACILPSLPSDRRRMESVASFQHTPTSWAWAAIQPSSSRDHTPTVRQPSPTGLDFDTWRRSLSSALDCSGEDELFLALSAASSWTLCIAWPSSCLSTGFETKTGMETRIRFVWYWCLPLIPANSAISRLRKSASRSASFAGGLMSLPR